MLSPELIAQIKQLQLKAGHLADDVLVGEYSSAFKGLGMEFDEVREYIPGDDVRSIDWNVTARAGVPHVKTYKEERELTMMLMVDVSPSQGFGTSGRLKSEIAAELAAVLAFLATKNNDKVGLIAFSDHVENYIPPGKGRAHIWRIIREILAFEGKGERTDVSGAFDFLLRVQKKRATCFMISDFWAEPFERSLRLAAKRHTLTCVRVEDVREHTLEPCGLVEFEDQETGERIVIDTSDRRFASRFAEGNAERWQGFEEFLGRLGVDRFAIRTGEPVTAPLIRYMRRRERRLSR